ncbi:DUF5067 domain-containing protein [Ignavigranum ruoffiae]|uniref:DUF5067 domain-containing protein n=2 Tax=Ignavigranum ruoffiae TaxID=89093 RepID=UPI0024ADA262|nr:DUF5067 domain-containing protein [Ignavigranum ruoffiae]
MRKKLIKLTACVMMAGPLSLSYLQNNQYPHALAQEAYDPQAFYNYMMENSPLTDEQWNAIPAEAWQSFWEANQNTSTMYPDSIMYLAMSAYPQVFAPEINRIRTTLEENGVHPDILANFTDMSLLWKAWSQPDLATLAQEMTANDEQNRENKGLPPRPYTDQEASQQVEDGFYDDMYNAVVNYGGISEEQLAKLPGDPIYDAAFAYKKSTFLGGDPSILYYFFIRMYPSVMNADEQPPKPYTEEEAIRLVKEGFYHVMYNAVVNYGKITEDQLAALPGDPIYDAAVAYKKSTFLGGDPGVLYHFFINMYPEVLNKELKVSDETRQARVAFVSKNQDLLARELVTKELVEQSDSFFKEPIIVENEGHNFKIRGAYLIQPAGVGNPNQDQYLLAIQYDYTNQTDQVVASSQAVWSGLSQMDNLTAEGSQQLSLGNYQLASEQTADDIETAIEPGQTKTQTIFYNLESLDQGLMLRLVNQDKVQNYKFEQEDLAKLPPFTGLFLGEANNFLFDGQRAYLLYADEASAKAWADQEGVEVKAWTDLSLTPEATLYKEKLDGEFTAVIFDNIYYTLQEGKIEMKPFAKADVAAFLSFEPNEDWTSFTDQEGNQYQIQE